MNKLVPKRRIYKAALAAVLCHALLIGASVFFIQWLSIPSTISRVLNLNLNSTPLDGYVTDHKTTTDTLNNADLGVSKSEQTAEPTDAEQTQELPPEEIASTPKPSAPSPSQVREKIESVAEISSTEPVSQQAENDRMPDESVMPSEEASLITKKQNKVVALAIPEKEPTVIQASQQQQDMLSEKLTEVVNSLQDLQESNEEFFEVEWESDGQRYSAALFRVPLDNDMGLPEIRVRVKTEVDGIAMSTEMSMKQLAFSNFAQFVHRWDQDLQIHDDQLDGRFHSNSRINLEFGKHSGPVFRGKVTTASYRVNMNRHSLRTLKKNVFLGGLETGVQKIAMPKPSMLYFDDSPTKDETSVTFDTNTRIVFSADGSYSAEPLDDDGAVSQHIIGQRPLYLNASPGVSLYLQGTINGQVLVYSPKRIIIEGHLKYADQSDSDENDDFLGLVSGRNIIIAPPSVTGRGDLEIDASIYAKGRFVVSAYKSRRSGTLIIFGSVSAGSMSATEPRYATKITFDPRLEDRRPPNFPTTDRYEVQNKNVSWSAVKQ